MSDRVRVFSSGLHATGVRVFSGHSFQLAASRNGGQYRQATPREVLSSISLLLTTLPF